MLYNAIHHLELINIFSPINDTFSHICGDRKTFAIYANLPNIRQPLTDKKNPAAYLYITLFNIHLIQDIYICYK